MIGRYFGLDLAWGRRNRSGLAVLARSGRLVESCSVVSDEDIVNFVVRHREGTEIAAIDAPLVVPNDVGRRPCEAEVSRLFGTFHAGAYPANRSNSLFAPPRAQTLSERLGWRIDPAQPVPTQVSSAIEVYPHAAMVSLFDLDRVIPYKAKPGRDLQSLLTAYQRLLDHIERCCGGLLDLAGSPRWQQIRGIAQAAVRISNLAAIEDEIDGVFCAYLGWLWVNEPATMMVIGDASSGFIVTPPPPSRSEALRVTKMGTARVGQEAVVISEVGSS